MRKNTSSAEQSLSSKVGSICALNSEIIFNEVVGFSLAWHCPDDQRLRTNDVAGHDVMTSVPSSSLTVTDWYKQPVYDKSDSKIGDIDDILVGPNGQIDAVIIGVGGFLGAGEKDVAVNFGSIKQTKKDNKTYLTLDTTKGTLERALGFKYDSTKTGWVPDKSNK